MKKRILVIMSFLPVSASLLAQTGLSAVGDVSSTIAVYLPYVLQSISPTFKPSAMSLLPCLP